MYKRNPNNLLRFGIFGFVALIVLVAVTYPLWIPYFVDDVVDEAFPTSSAANNTESETSVESTEASVEVEAESLSTQDNQPTESAAAENAQEEAEPVPLFSGTFSYIDAVHNGEGTATIYELADGSRILRFEGFEVTNGPDLHVILSPNTPEGLADSVGEYVNLGSLKGNIGNQNYDIPADVNLADYASVVIYCEPFRVTFSAAILSPAE